VPGSTLADSGLSAGLDLCELGLLRSFSLGSIGETGNSSSGVTQQSGKVRSEGKGLTEPLSETAGNVITYAYRPTVMGAMRDFKLSEDGIDWGTGFTSGHIPYRNVRRVRMSFRPTSIQSHRFLTEVWGEGAPRLKIASSSWKSMVEQERLDRSYSAFVQELHRRVSAAAPSARFERGVSPLIYWPGVVVFTGVALGLAGLVARALQAGTYAGAAFIGAFFALYLWHSTNFLRRNRPGVYGGDVLPQDVMPPRPP
jgi:hypothetical protein